MEVIFLRHAKTDLNGKGYIATKKDYFLNEIGREECLRNVFPPNSFNRVYCSSYKRTVETVKIVYPYLDPVIFSDLTQRDLGELNEKMEKDIDDLYVFLAKYCRIPDKTILLVDDYNKCIFRVEQRNKMPYNRKEKYILKKSYDMFKKMSVKYSNRIYTININNLSEEEVLNKIMNIINK